VKNRVLYNRAARVVVLLAALCSTPRVKADTLTFNFTNTFSGTGPAASGVPWLQMMFEDVSPGTVRLTISNSFLTGNEFVSDVYFNLRPTLNPTNLNLANLGSSGGFSLPTISKGLDAEKADGDGFYDVYLAFGTSSSKRFGPGEWLSYNLSGIPDLTVNDFPFLSSPGGGTGTFFAAAHVQGIGGGSLSGWVGPTEAIITPVPEPAPVLLVGLGIGLLLAEQASRRKLQKRQRL